MKTGGILVVMALTLVSLVLAGPTLPAPPLVPSEPSESDLFTVTPSVEPSNPTNREQIRFLATFNYQGTPTTADGGCTYSVDTYDGAQHAASGSLTYVDPEYEAFSATYYYPYVFNLSVTCTNLGEDFTARTQFTVSASDAGHSLVLGVDPAYPFNDSTFVLYGEFENVSGVIADQYCLVHFWNQSFNSGAKIALYNETTHRQETWLEGGDYAIGAYSYDMICDIFWYGPWDFQFTNESSFTLYDRSSVHFLDLGHSPSSVDEGDDVVITARYYDGYDVPLLSGCNVSLNGGADGSDLVMSYSSGVYVFEWEDVPQGTNTYVVVCGDSDLSDSGSFIAAEEDTGGGGGGGGGGGYYPPFVPPVCSPDWSCSVWDACSNGYQRRDCIDVNVCGDTSSMPPILQACSASCSDGVLNGDELGVDCGGSLCEPCGVDDPSHIKPQFSRRPLLVTPGEPVVVEIFNEGLETYDGLTVVVGDVAGQFEGLLAPGDVREVEVDLPLNILLVQEELPVRLLYGAVVLDSGLLPVEVVWPEYGAYLDAVGQEARVYVVVNNLAGVESQDSVEVELRFFQGGQETYLDMMGPYDAPAGEVLIRSVVVPSHYLDEGDVEVRARFYLGGEFVTESAGVFSSTLSGGFNFLPVIVIVLVALVVVMMYFALDMAYNKRGFKQEFSSLFKKKP